MAVKGEGVFQIFSKVTWKRGADITGGDVFVLLFNGTIRRYEALAGTFIDSYSTYPISWPYDWGVDQDSDGAGDPVFYLKTSATQIKKYDSSGSVVWTYTAPTNWGVATVEANPGAGASTVIAWLSGNNGTSGEDWVRMESINAATGNGTQLYIYQSVESPGVGISQDLNIESCCRVGDKHYRAMQELVNFNGGEPLNDWRVTLHEHNRTTGALLSTYNYVTLDTIYDNTVEFPRYIGPGHNLESGGPSASERLNAHVGTINDTLTWTTTDVDVFDVNPLSANTTDATALTNPDAESRAYSIGIDTDTDEGVAYYVRDTSTRWRRRWGTTNMTQWTKTESTVIMDLVVTYDEG